MKAQLAALFTALIATAAQADCTYHLSDSTVRIWTDKKTLSAIVTGLAEKGWTEASDDSTSQALIVRDSVLNERQLTASLIITDYRDRQMHIASVPAEYPFPRRHNDNWKKKMDRRRHAALLASLETFPECSN